MAYKFVNFEPERDNPYKVGEQFKEWLKRNNGDIVRGSLQWQVMPHGEIVVTYEEVEPIKQESTQQRRSALHPRGSAWTSQRQTPAGEIQDT